jgi:hypothetical protein
VKNLHFLSLQILGLLIISSAHSYSEENIAPHSIVTTTPYIGSSIKYLNDGRIEADHKDNTYMIDAPLGIMLDRQVKVGYELAFPKPTTISSLRMFQFSMNGRRWATSYVIKIDVDGDGSCEKVLKNETKGEAGRWMEHRFTEKPLAYKLCLKALRFNRKKGPDYGGPVIGEIEIYTSDPITPLLGEKAKKNTTLVKAFEKNGSRLQIHSLLISNDKLWYQQFAKGVFASMWKYWEPSRHYSHLNNQIIINRLIGLGVNRLWLYPGAYIKKINSVDKYLMPSDVFSRYYINRKNDNKSIIRIYPFPSVVDISSKKNILNMFSDQIHKNKLGIFINEMILPYGTNGWDFPRVQKTKEYPSLCSSFVRNKSLELYREIMESGVDGMALGGDEFFIYKGIAQGNSDAPICYENGVKKEICKPECSDLFNDWLNTSNENIGSPNRQTLFQYTIVADWFVEYKKMMNTINDKSISTSLFRSGEQNRLGYGIAYDVIGASGSIDELSSNPYWSKNSYLGHYYFSNETKKLVGANYNRKATVTLQTTPNFDNIGYENPIMLYGPTFSSLMHGISGINYYKQDYLYDRGLTESGKRVKNIFSLITYLEQLGINEFSIEKDVALLYSRASEDWWQLKHKAIANKAVEAHLTQNAVMEVLFKESIPFELYYLDQPSLLKNLDDYKLVILPFPYSISHESHALINKLVSKGKKVLAINANGEVDEVGNMHSTPLLNDTDYIHVDIPFVNTNYSNVSSKLLPVIRTALHGKGGLTVNDQGHDLECTIHRHGYRDEKLLYCVNWEGNKHSALFNVAVSGGYYTIDKITPEYVVPIVSDSGKEFSSDDMSQLQLEILPWETFIFHIRKVNKKKTYNIINNHEEYARHIH